MTPQTMNATLLMAEALRAVVWDSVSWPVLEAVTSVVLGSTVRRVRRVGDVVITSLQVEGV